jgi:hypothetical protein
MAIVVDGLTSTGHELTIPDGAYTTADDDKSEFDAVSTIETMLRNRISSIEIDANGQRRRILKNHHHNHRHRRQILLKKSKKTRYFGLQIL